MRLTRQVAVLGASILVLSGCGLLGGEPEAVAPTRPSLESSGAPAPSIEPSASASGLSDPSASATPEQPDLSRFYDQKIKWTNCGNADCATIVAPLDYSDPEGPTIDLAITRVKSTGDAIGSLFVDPGGPGGSAVDYAKAADYIVSPAVRKHFDVVGLDPRGVGGSSPLTCMTDEQMDELGAADGTPDSPAEERRIEELSTIPGAGCAAKSDPVYAHVGTVDAARDLDLARALVKDETLNYLGKSYGTMLGATYAELFPDRVGRMVLDGVLPASLDLIEVTKGQADAFEVAVRDFARDCLTHSNCPLSGTVDDAVGQLQDWFTSLDRKPLPGRGGESRDLNEPLAQYAVLSNLYFPGYDYPRLRAALADAMNRDDPTKLLGILDERIDRAPDGRYTSNSTEAFYAVTCLDRPFEGTTDDVRALAEEWRATAPTFGPALAWGLLTCRDWPASGEQVTSTVAEGSNPILVVSTRKDPATPYQWGQLLAEQLDNGHLVTYEGVGHTAYYDGSSCVDDTVDAYLLKGKVPEKDPVCT
jgi:pimeloyl-ACP methyl ester carboxylesterase